MAQISVGPEISTMLVGLKENIHRRIALGPKWQGNKRVGMRSHRTKGLKWII